MSVDFEEERAEYEAIHRGNLARYEATPWHQLRRRRRAMAATRRSYAAVVQAGGRSPHLPSTTRQTALSTLAAPFRWKPRSDGEIFVYVVAVFTLAVTLLIVGLVEAIDPSGRPDPLPTGVSQEAVRVADDDGEGTVLRPGFRLAVSAVAAGTLDLGYHDLVNICDRLPGEPTYADDLRVDESTGDYLITCEP